MCSAILIATAACCKDKICHVGLLQVKVAAETIGFWQAAGSAIQLLLNCSIPDDHIDFRRSAFFKVRSIFREVRDG
jgi:hypothetical protein